MKAIGYTRVSTDEQAREGVSLDNQRTKITAYCELHDLELVEVIEDGGKSGKNLNRDGITRLMELVKTHQIDAVIVYKLDRLSRRVIDTLTLIEHFQKHSVAFHSLSESIDTSSAMGKFFLNIMASLAQMERDLIAERTRDALQHKIRKGERAGQIPYGFTLSPDGKTLIPNIEEQRTISLIRELVGKGYSYRAVCRELETRNIRPVGKAWHHQTIRNILAKAA